MHRARNEDRLPVHNADNPNDDIDKTVFFIPIGVQCDQWSGSFLADDRRRPAAARIHDLPSVIQVLNSTQICFIKYS